MQVVVVEPAAAAAGTKRRRPDEEGEVGSLNFDHELLFAHARKLGVRLSEDQMIEIHQVVAKKEATVSEVFCYDRFTSRCRRFGLQPGYALDLTTGWDLDDPEQMQQAEELQITYEPQVLIGSPSCRAHSQLLKFNVRTKRRGSVGARHR